MTIEEYSQYLFFSVEIGRKPYPYNEVKYMSLKKLFSIVKEPFNIHDLSYIKYMNQGIDQFVGLNKYLNKKFGNVNLKIK